MQSWFETRGAVALQYFSSKGSKNDWSNKWQGVLDWDFVKKMQSSIFVIDTSICKLPLYLVYDKKILHLRRQFYIAKELYRIMSLNIDKIKNSSCTFRHFQPTMKILFIVQKSKNFNSNTFVQIEGYQLKSWRKKSQQNF